ncbi:hypothetical protein BH23BAC1_BH23BAC1_06130 [soil metagenome]
MPNFLILTGILVFTQFLPLQAQELSYDIVWKGDSIGFLHASKIPTKNMTRYEIDSQASFRFIAKIELDYYFENVFSNGVLVKGISKHSMNNKLKSSSSIKWDGKKYNATVDDLEVPLDKKAVKTSMTSMYYQEPVGINEIFSERYAVYCAIKPVGTNKYELTLPNGKKNYYTYEGGICTLVEVNHPMATFYFKLRQNNGELVMN